MYSSSKMEVPEKALLNAKNIWGRVSRKFL
jgi:hypothetical protein